MSPASPAQPVDILPKQEPNLLRATQIWAVEEMEPPFLSLDLPDLEGGVIPALNSSGEAQLLLDSAWAECKLFRIQKELADQLMHCNLLRLECSRLQAEQAEQDLLSVELHIGQAQLVIRWYGYALSLCPGTLGTDHEYEFPH